MVIRKNMTNQEIYQHASELFTAFEDFSNSPLPVKVLFYLQKNVDKIVEMGKEIEKSRTNIFEKYGTLDEEKQVYTFENDKVEIANQEILDLLALEQEVKYNAIPLEWLDKVELTPKQVSAFSFMIQEEEE
jgi:hypothetical protein